jgi:predicted dehydrogenase
MLRLGIIGISPGNGHLYSWSAICNGYDPGRMANCPFALIPQYLGEQKWPDARLGLAEVTHIWTQDRAVSEDAAACSLIPNIVDRYEEMIGQVDGVLLARDDAELHFEIATPFLRAGLPVYIDKPMALSRAEGARIYAEAAHDWQVFSGSALRYSSHLLPYHGGFSHPDLGDIQVIRALTPRLWDTYSPHVIDPVLGVLGDPAEPDSVQVITHGTRTTMQLAWKDGPVAQLVTLGADSAFVPFTVEIMGTKASVRLELTDYFHAFRNALRAFAQGVMDQRPALSREAILRSVSLIEKGRS